MILKITGWILWFAGAVLTFIFGIRDNDINFPVLIMGSFIF